MAESLNAVVTQRVEVAPGLIILRVVPDGWAVPDFKPGQFAVLGLPWQAKRYVLSTAEIEPITHQTRVFHRFCVCGNPAMIEDMVKLLEAEGYTEHKPRAPGNIHMERYW